MYLSKFSISNRFINSPFVPLMEFVDSYKILVCFRCRFNLIVLINLLFLAFSLKADDKSVRYTPSVRAVYKAMPATVVISELVENDGVFLQPITKPKVLGTGVVIDPEGYILTSEHVVHGYDDLEIITFKGEKYSSEVLFSSEEMDLALIKVKSLKDKLPVIKFAFPNDLLLAEPVIAIGNPYGLTFSISDGILSSTGRKLKIKSKLVFDDLLQTSIKVNPGNSGGPLINMNGEMIGVMVASQNEAQGIGFAIPIAKIEKIVSAWFSPERQSHAELGFDVVSEFDAKGDLGYAVVKNVQIGKLNNLLGVRNDQKIKSVDGVSVRNAMDFYRYVKAKKVGQQLSVITHKDRKFFVQLFPLKGLTLAKSKLGLKFQRLGPDIARAISLPFDKGFVLSGFKVGAGLGMFKVRRGDMLFKISNRIILNDADFQDLLKDVKPGDRIPVVFLRVVPEGDASHVETIHDIIIVN